MALSSPQHNGCTSLCLKYFLADAGFVLKKTLHAISAADII